MNKKDLLIAHLADGSCCDDLYRQHMFYLPEVCFEHSWQREVYKCFKTSSDPLDLSDEARYKITDIISSEDYKMFKELDSESKVRSLESVLDSYRLEKISSYSDSLMSSISKNKMIDKSLNEFVKSVSRLPSFARAENLQETMGRVIEEGNRYLETNESVIHPTQFAKINKLIGGGLRGGDIFTIAADTGIGKTNLGLDLVDHYANQGKSCLINSLEMSDSDLVKRLILKNSTDIAGLPNFSLASLDTPNQKEVAYTSQIISKISHYNIDYCRLPKAEEFKMFLAKKAYDVIVIDHIHLTYRHTEAAFLDDYLQVIKDYVAENNSICILMAQVRKAPAGTSDFVPTSADILGFSSIKSISSQIIILYKQDNIYKGIVTKSRFHEAGENNIITFNTNRTRHKEV